MGGFWQVARDHLRSGQRLFVALVADHTRHSPGTRGARMLLTPEGLQVGTIGGGAMEQALLARGREALQGGGFDPEVRDLYHRRTGPGERSGLICAGRQTNVAFVCEPDRDLPALEDAAARIEADAAGLLTFTPGVGLRVEDEAASPQRAPVRLERGQPWRYEEQLLEWRRVAIFGAGHCGLALSRQMATLGYVVTVADTRPEVPTLLTNDAARHRVIVEDYAQAAAQVGHPEVTCAVVMTADFPSDTRALLGAVERPFPYLGVMGAPAKLIAIREALMAQGVSRARLDALRAPIGLPIHSATPEEIAVSVAAQLLQERPSLFPATRPAPLTEAPEPLESQPG